MSLSANPPRAHRRDNSFNENGLRDAVPSTPRLEACMHYLNARSILDKGEKRHERHSQSSIRRLPERS